MNNYTFPAGKVVIEVVDGAAVDTEIELQPAKGECWIVLMAYTYHDDATSRTLSWKITDGTNAITYTASAAVAAYDKIWIHNTRPDVAKDTAGIPGMIMLTNGVYATSTVAALAAGKKLYIRALTLQISGIYT